MEQNRMIEIDALLDAALSSTAFIAELTDEEYKAYLKTLNDRKADKTEDGWNTVAQPTWMGDEDVKQLQRRHNLITTIRSAAKRQAKQIEDDSDKTEEQLDAEKIEKALATILKLLANNGFSPAEYTLIEANAAAGRAKAQIAA